MVLSRAGRFSSGHWKEPENIQIEQMPIPRNFFRSTGCLPFWDRLTEKGRTEKGRTEKGRTEKGRTEKGRTEKGRMSRNI